MALGFSVDSEGQMHNDHDVSERMTAGSMARKSFLMGDYNYENTQFVKTLPDDDSPAYHQRDITVKFEARFFTPEGLRVREDYDPIFARGTYRVPIEITIGHLVTTLPVSQTTAEELERYYTIIRTDTFIIPESGVYYSPRRVRDDEWYELRLLNIRPL